MKELLRACRGSEAAKLHEVLSKLNQVKTLWYFSCGKDLRPITYFTFQEHIERMSSVQVQGIDIFIYNTLPLGDYSLFNQLPKKKILFKDDRTQIVAEEIIYCYPVAIPEINSGYYDFSDVYIKKLEGNPRPVAALIKLRLDSVVYGSRYCWLLYFEMENFYFLREYLLKNNISPTIICGKREGMAWGGARKSMNKYLQDEVINSTTFNPAYYLVDSIKPGSRTIISKDRYTMTCLTSLNWESKGYEFVGLYKLNYH